MQSTNLIPTAYFGPIKHQSIIAQSDCIIEKNEFFIKQSLRTRCDINGANGIITLKVPRYRKNSSKTPIKDIKINYDHPWQKEHWKSIKSAYQSSPFFEYYCDELIPFFETKYSFLIDLNMETQEKLIEIIGLENRLSTSDDFKPYSDNDWRKSSFISSNNITKYEQVFSSNNKFVPDLSILDLLFNLGPETDQFLKNTDISIKL
tara:strand:- start:35267 stop:35881 length:615 start_codon:yes stop_codon:yes gene_type:complete